MLAQRRFGITRPEVLVLLVLAGVAVGATLPAIAKARALSNRERCASNLKQIGEASNQYSATHNGQLPSPGGYLLQILPYTEHHDISDAIEKSGKPWNHPINAELVAKHLTIAQCPDTPEPDRLIGGKAPTDYTACTQITTAIRSIFPDNHDLSTPLGGGRGNNGSKLNEVTDGLSSTFLGVLEIADKPNRWVAGKKTPTTREDGGGGGNGTWAANGLNAPRGYSRDGKDAPGPCAMNCSNFAAVYSFHPEGCNFVFADGSVRFMKQKMDVWVFYACLTRKGGELITEFDY